MSRLAKLAMFLISIFLTTNMAQAFVRINVNLSSQTMEVQSSSGANYSWPISSARSGYVTPRGVYSPTSLQVMHRSKKYHNSPMPHSIFFYGGFAIHGTYETAALGRPASHGCIRVAPANAAKLYSLVRAEGATISIYGEPPPSHPFAHENSGRQRHYASVAKGAGAKGTSKGASHPGARALAYAPAPPQNPIERIFGAILAH